MQIEEYDRLESDSTADIRALLQGHVFHVTKRAYWQAITATGALLPNTDFSFTTTFGSSKNSFFRNLGCVSVFDYRAPQSDEIDGFRYRCDPLQAAKPGESGIVILILNPSIYDDLIPWTKWKEEERYSQMVVPYVEAGYPGSLALENVDKAIFFRQREDQSCLSAILRRAST